MTITLSITTAGIPWSSAELARITPDQEDPLGSVQTQLEALGYRVTTIQWSGMEVSAEVEPVCACPEPGLHRGSHCIAKRYGAHFQSDDWCYCACHRTPVTLAADTAFDSAMAQAALEHNLRGGRS